MRKAAATVGILLPVLLAWAAVSVSAAVVPPTGAREGKFFFPIDPQVKECWNSFVLIPGCVDELVRSFFTGTIGIGPACCKVINEVADKCFPKFAGIYPFNPAFAPMIKVHCQASAAPPARAPLSSSPFV